MRRLAVAIALVPILDAQRGHDDPGQKIITMRGGSARPRAEGVANPKAITDEDQLIFVR